ncbi:MAG: type II secretion system protein [Gammaproteobacteria bacterium]|nr:type II secretion system protein [Gammaproteobacteria bacterium]
MDVLNHKKTRGFTLVEAVIVISVIAILATFIGMKIPSAPAVNMSTQAQQLANDIRYTQLLAMSKGQRYYITLGGSSYQILGLDGTTVIMANGSTSVTLGTGITISGKTNLPNSLISFDGEGTPYTDITATPAALAAQATITLSGGGITAIITIAPNTGWATVS